MDCILEGSRNPRIVNRVSDLISYQVCGSFISGQAQILTNTEKATSELAVCHIWYYIETISHSHLPIIRRV